MKYVLDTTAVSALMDGVPAAKDAIGSLGRRDVSVPNPVWAEVAYGIARLAPSKRRDILQGRYLAVRDALPRASWTDAVTERFAEIRASLEKRGQRLEDFDLAIAAHALAADAVLVTANVKHMRRIPGLRVEDWAADK